MKRFLSELQRRDVIKALVAYVGFSWLILQIVSVLISVLGISPLAGTATFIVLIGVLPIVMYLSWHFDFTLQGITRTPSLDQETNKTLKPLGSWSWIGLLAILVVSGFIGVQYFDSVKESLSVLQKSEVVVQKSDSIAVLPFDDVSAEQDQAYLAVGLAEEITSLLGRSDLFKVSASRSSQVLAEKGLSPMEIGQRLDAQTILTGTISAENNRVKVDVELIDTQTGRTLWTETFLREFKDIFDLESEIGRAVVNTLQDKYAETGDLASLSTTSSVDAYVLYLKGREEYRKQTTESMQEARTLFEQAISADPEYAKAYVALADTLAMLSEGTETFGILKVDIAANLATQNIKKALEREPNIPEIYAVQGVVNILRNEYEESLVNLKKAVELNPSLAITYMWKSYALTMLQQFDEAILAQRQSQQLDPLFLTSTYNLGLLLSWQGQYEESEALFSQMRIDFPQSAFSHIGSAGLYYSQGNYAGAIREWKKAIELSPDNKEFSDSMIKSVSMLGLVDIIEDLTTDPFYDATILIIKQKYDELFEKMAFDVASNPDDYWVAFEAGWYHAMFGDVKTAVSLLTKNEESVSESDKFYMPYCSPAIEMAWAHQVLGNTNISKELIDRCESLLNMQRQSSIVYSETDYLAARIYALKGESAKAIKALQIATKNGWREWWTRYDPLLKPLNEDKEMQKLLKVIEDDLAKQREEVRSLFIKER
jgi:TolB-like protein/Flp pilus assembly protein TadD